MDVISIEQVEELIKWNFHFGWTWLITIVFPNNVMDWNDSFVYKIIYLNYLLHYKKKILAHIHNGTKVWSLKWRVLNICVNELSKYK
jgi:hypothetical protein